MSNYTRELTDIQLRHFQTGFSQLPAFQTIPHAFSTETPNNFCPETPPSPSLRFSSFTSWLHFFCAAIDATQIVQHNIIEWVTFPLLPSEYYNSQYAFHFSNEIVCNRHFKHKLTLSGMSTKSYTISNSQNPFLFTPQKRIGYLAYFLAWT